MLDVKHTFFFTSFIQMGPSCGLGSDQEASMAHRLAMGPSVKPGRLDCFSQSHIGAQGASRKYLCEGLNRPLSEDTYSEMFFLFLGK